MRPPTRPGRRLALASAVLLAIVAAALWTATRSGAPVNAARDQAVNTTDPTGLERRLPAMSFRDAALGDVLNRLRDASGENLYFDWRALGGAGITRKTPISLELPADQSLSDAIVLLLDTLRTDGATEPLDFFESDGVVMVSTREDLWRKRAQAARLRIERALAAPPAPPATAPAAPAD